MSEHMMALENAMFKDFDRAQVTSKRGFEYDYCISKPAEPGKPWIVLLHGFCSGKGNFNKLSKSLKGEGYGIILPSLLGYAPSSQPKDVQSYNGKEMADDIADILDKRNVQKAVFLSHDHGSGLHSNVLVYHQSRVLASIFFNVGYIAPSRKPFDMAALNQMTKQFFGYETNGYFAWFGQVPPTAGAAIKEHWESAKCLFFPKDPNVWKEHLGPTGAAPEWITSDRKCDVDPALTKEAEDYGKEVFDSSIDTALFWYGAMLENVNLENSKKLSDDDLQVKVPTLYLGGNKDCACPPAGQTMQMKTTVPNLEIHNFDDLAHWMPEFQADQMLPPVLAFFSKNGL